MPFPFETDPGFAALSWKDQIRLRTQATLRLLSKDAQFLRLSEAEQSRLVQDASVKPPIFENQSPEMQELFRGLQEKIAERDWTTVSLYDVTGNLVRHTGVVGKAVTGLQRAVAPVFGGGAEVSLAREMAFGADGRKLSAWIQSEAAKDPDPAIGQMFRSNELTTTLLAEIGSTMGLFYGSGIAVGARAAGGALKAIGEKAASPLARWFFADFLPTAVHNAAFGLQGAGQELLSPLLSGEVPDTKLGSIAKNFGLYAAGDSLFWTALNWGWPFLRLAGRTLGSFGRNSQKISEALKIQNPDGSWRQMSGEERKTYTRAYTLGDLEPAQFNSLNDTAKDRLRASKENTYFSERPEEAMRNPYGRAVLAGRSLGLDVVQLGPDAAGYRIEGEGYRVRSVEDPSWSAQVGTIAELDDVMRPWAEQWLKSHPEQFAEKLRTDPLRGYLLRMSEREAAVREAYSWAKPDDARGDFRPAGERYRVNPLEVEGVRLAVTDPKAGGFADSFNLPVPKEALEKAAKEGRLFPRGSRPVPLDKSGEMPNAFAVFRQVAGQEELQAAQAWAARAKTAGAKDSIEDLVFVGLRRFGYDAADLGGGKFLALYPESQIKLLDAGISPRTGKPGWKPKVESGLKDVTLTLDTLKTRLPNKALEGDNFLLGALVDEMGPQTEPARVQRFTQILLQKAGLDSRVKVQVLEGAKDVVVRQEKEGLRLLVPKEIPEGAAFSQKIVEALKTHAVSQMKKALSSQAAEAAAKTGPEVEENLQKWFQNLAKTDPNVRRWMISQKAKSWKALSEKLLASEYSTAEMKADLAKKGFRVEEQKGKIRVFRGAVQIAEGPTPAAVLEKLEWQPQKLSSKYAPKVVGLDPDGITFETAGYSVSGGPEQVFPFLSRFEDKALEAAKRVIFKTGEGELSVLPGSRFRVDIPNYGISRVFSDGEEAKKFISGAWKEWGNWKRMAGERGGVLRFRDGFYDLVIGGKHYSASTIEELGQVFRALPDPTHVPDLVGPDSEMFFKPDKTLGSFTVERPAFTAEPSLLGRPSLWKTPSVLWKPMTAWVSDYAKKLGRPDVLKSYEDIQAGLRLASRDSDVGVELLEKTLSLGGKFVSSQRREGIFHLMGEPDGVRRESIKAAFGLSDEDLVIESELRDLLGRGPDQGLFNKFGIDPNKFIFQYMSRVRAVIDNETLRYLNDPAISEKILEKAFGKDIPSEVRFWAEHMREAELPAFALDTDVYSVMRKYITRGDLKLYVGGPFQEMYRLLNTEGMDKVLRWRTLRYMDMLQGGGFSDGEKLAQDWGAALMERLGKKGAEAKILGHDVLRSLYSLSYVTHLGWRPFVAIRNLMQMYQTTGPLLGNSFLEKAIQFLARDDGTYVSWLRRQGILHRQPLLVNQIADSESLLGKIQDSGLSMFKTTEDITRGISYRAGELKFEAMQKAGIPLEKAQGYLGSNLLGPEVDSRVQQALAVGDLAGAKHLYAQGMGERAMFVLRREQAPVAFHGLVGKMFGQYGTFAANYVQFVAQTWKWATPAQKAAFAGRWIANSAALAGAAYAVGLRYQDWLPWSPAQFTGGPLFNLLIDGIHAIGNDYQARQSRGELNRMLPVDLNKLLSGKGFELQPPVGMPSYYQLRTILKVNEYAQKGDAVRAFWALLSAPIRSE